MKVEKWIETETTILQDQIYAFNFESPVILNALLNGCSNLSKLFQQHHHKIKIKVIIIIIIFNHTNNFPRNSGSRCQRHYHFQKSNPHCHGKGLYILLYIFVLFFCPFPLKIKIMTVSNQASNRHIDIVDRSRPSNAIHLNNNAKRCSDPITLSCDGQCFSVRRTVMHHPVAKLQSLCRDEPTGQQEFGDKKNNIRQVKEQWFRCLFLVHSLKFLQMCMNFLLPLASSSDMSDLICLYTFSFLLCRE